MTRRIPPQHRGVLRAPLACILLLAAAAAASADPAELEQILSNFDRVQGSVQTLSAEFTETTSNALLIERETTSVAAIAVRRSALRCAHFAARDTTDGLRATIGLCSRNRPRSSAICCAVL